MLTVTNRSFHLFFSLALLLFLTLSSTLPTSAAALAAPAAMPSGATFSATVLADVLYIFNGPGTHYPITAYAYAGETLSVEGQSNQCAWLLVRNAEGVYGWASGRWLLTNFACSQLGKNAPANTIPKPAPTATPHIRLGDYLRKGCYLFQNYAGVDITITIWPQNNAWSKAIFVAKDTDVQECFDAQRYNYRLDAAGLVSKTGELNIKMGEHYKLPIWAK